MTPTKQTIDARELQLALDSAGNAAKNGRNQYFTPPAERLIHGTPIGAGEAASLADAAFEVSQRADASFDLARQLASATTKLNAEKMAHAETAKLLFDTTAELARARNRKLAK